MCSGSDKIQRFCLSGACVLIKYHYFLDFVGLVECMCSDEIQRTLQSQGYSTISIQAGRHQGTYKFNSIIQSSTK